MRALFAFLLLAAAPRLAASQAVAARELPRGAVLAAEDIAGDTTPQVTGWVTRRVVKKGEPLREPAVTPAPIVTHGAAVTIRATVEGVTVSRPAIALADGSLGAAVRVRLSSQRTVNAVVTGPATVRVP